MSTSRTRIPSPARSMPLTPRRRETPRKTRSVCSPARSNASGRLSCIIREHKEQALGPLSPLNRRSVLTDNTDIEEPGRKSWWRDLGENSRDVMEVLKDNIVEPHNIFENIEILSQEEKRYTLDLPDSSDSESIHSIVIPQRKLFYEKENQPQKNFNQFGTREALEKLHKANTAVDNTVSTTIKQLFQTKPQSRPVFPAALLDISTNTTASEKTMAAVVETKGRVHNLFRNQQNVNKPQTTKRKNMFAKFIASDSEEELPEIQPKFFALQKKPDSRHPSLSSRGLDTSMASSMDIELDDWQHLPSSTMVEHQLNTTLTAGQKSKRPRLSKLSEAETGTNSSDASKTKQSNKSYSSKIQDKSPRQNTSIVTRNSSKIFKDADNGINSSQNKSQSSSNTSQSSIVTRSRNKSDVANKSQNASINKSRNSNKSKNVSLTSNQIDEGINAVNNSVSNSNQNMDAGDKEHEDKMREPEDNESDELNFSLQCQADNADEVDEANVTQNKSAHSKSNKDINVSKNISKKLIASKENSTKNISLSEQNVQKAKNRVIEESVEISGNNEIHLSSQNVNEEVITDENINENLEEKTQNKSQKADNQRKEIDNQARNKESKEQSQHIEQENDNSIDKQIENDQVEGENEPNQSENKANETLENINEIQENQSESVKFQKEIEDEHSKSQEENTVLQDESQEMQNDTEEEAEKVSEVDNESEAENKSEEENESETENESEAENECEAENVSEAENESEAENNVSLEEIEDEPNTSQEEIEQNESGPNVQEECEETNESIEADRDADDNPENDSDHIENDEDQEIDMECEDPNQSLEAAAESVQNDSDHIENQENDSDEENDMECEDVNESIESAAESDQNDNQENDQHVDDDQINDTESPNVSHDITGSKKKSVTPEAILRNSKSVADLTTIYGQNTSIRKTKSMIQHLSIKRILEPARESLEFFDGTKNSSNEGSGWDSHRTTRKTLRETFGKDFTPRKSLRALVMEKSAKRQTTVVNETVAMPQANSTEFPEPELSTNDHELDDDPPVHEVSLRTRQAKIVEILEMAKKDWAEMDAKAAAVVKHRLEQGRTTVEDPFKKPKPPTFLRPASKSKPKAKKPLQSLIPLESMPEEFIEDMKYKPPKRFAPRNAAWLTKRLYKYLETKLEPKYNYKSRVRAEKFAQTLYEFVQSVRRRGAADVAPKHAVAALKQEMARLNFVKTHFDFYNFFHDFMPREVRVKVIPDTVNNIPHPKNGVFSDIL